MAQIDIFPLTFNGISPPLNLVNSLFSDPLTNEHLSYPIDLGSNPHYSHIVQFTALDFDYKIKETVKNLSNDFNNAIGTLTNSNNADIAAKSQNLQNSLKQLAKDINISGGLSTTTNEIPRGTISLYMPDTLTTEYTQDYSQISLTEVMGTLGLLGSNVSDAMKDSDKNGDSSTGNFWNPYAKALGIWVAEKVGPNVGSIAANALKQIPNPQLQLLYKGVALREFQFEFRFTPTSNKEAQSVDRIIKAFTYFSSPSLLGSEEKSHQYLVPPQMFKIKFAFMNNSTLTGAVTSFFRNIGTNILSSDVTNSLFGGTTPIFDNNSTLDNSKIFTIKNNCVLTNISVDYAPNGWASHNDGYPIETRMTLHFKETDIVTKELIDFVPSNINTNQTIDNILLPSIQKPLPTLDEIF